MQKCLVVGTIRLRSSGSYVELGYLISRYLQNHHAISTDGQLLGIRPWFSSNPFFSPVGEANKVFTTIDNVL